MKIILMESEGVYENAGAATEKVYGGLTKMGVYENLLPVAGGQRKFTAKGRGVYETFPDFNEFRPIPLSDIK